jgi:hypothetical protein
MLTANDLKRKTAYHKLAKKPVKGHLKKVAKD